LDGGFDVEAHQECEGDRFRFVLRKLSRNPLPIACARGEDLFRVAR
jgi:hypothetical protein